MLLCILLQLFKLNQFLDRHHVWRSHDPFFILHLFCINSSNFETRKTWINLAPLGSTWLNLAQLGSTWLNLAQLGSNWLNSAQLSSTCLKSAQLSYLPSYLYCYPLSYLPHHLYNYQMLPSLTSAVQEPGYLDISR